MRRFAFVFLLVFSAAAYAADAAFPPLTGRVVDQAGILSAQVEGDIAAKLEAHEQATGHQVVVATIATLDGRDIAEYGVEFGRAWGIGQKEKSNGAILLVAPNERAVRIEVGYGLEGQLTDATSRLIIENSILPSFRDGRMDAGIVAGVDAILAVLRGDPDAVPQPPSPVRTKDPGEIPIIVIMIIFFVITRLRRKRRGILPVLLDQSSVWSSGSRRGGGFGGFGGGGRGGGGGFRGGGGSFGGGGASGKW